MGATAPFLTDASDLLMFLPLIPMVKIRPTLLLLVPLLFGVALAPHTQAQNFPLAVIEQRVIRYGIRQQALPRHHVRVRAITAETWPDGCLGVSNPVELCMAVLTEGWRVVLTDGEQDWGYRTDAQARQIRPEPLVELGGLSAATATRILATAQADSGLPLEQLEISTAEQRIWDGCLGIYPTPNTPCTKIAIAGWRAIVTGPDQAWIYHSDDSGSDVRLNPYENPEF